MAFEVIVEGQTVRISIDFWSGKDLVHIDGEPVFKGSLRREVHIDHGDRLYIIEKAWISKFTGTSSINIKVSERGEVIFDRMFDEKGNQVFSVESIQKEAMSNIFLRIGGFSGLMIGMVITNFIFMNAGGGMINGMVFGGVMGGICAGIGAAFGKAIADSRS